MITALSNKNDDKPTYYGIRTSPIMHDMQSTNTGCYIVVVVSGMQLRIA